MAAATLDAYAAGLIDGSGGRAPAPEYRWWALAVQIDDLAPVAARADDWLRPTDVAAWRRRLRQAMQLPEAP